MNGKIYTNKKGSNNMKHLFKKLTNKQIPFDAEIQIEDNLEDLEPSFYEVGELISVKDKVYRVVYEK